MMLRNNYGSEEIAAAAGSMSGARPGDSARAHVTGTHVFSQRELYPVLFA